MPVKILLIGGPLSNNLGGPSVLAGGTKALSEQFPDPRFTLLNPSGNTEGEEELAGKYGVDLIEFDPTFSYMRQLLPRALVKRIFGVASGPPWLRRFLNTFREADIIIDVWGIAFADSLGSNSFACRLRDGFFFAIGKVLGKPVVKSTADLGPFEQKWNRFFAKFYLQHCVDLILARDDETQRCVAELGVRTKMLTCPDSAFLLEPCQTEVSERLAGYRRNHPVIGISVSFQLHNRAHDPAGYIRMMSDVARHVISVHNAHVVVIPNDVSDGPNDDERLADEVCGQVGEHCEVVRTGSFLAGETKGVIGECDAILAARYHSVVAALSQGVPTFAIAWHHKYKGILSLFGLQRWMSDIGEVNSSDLIRLFDEMLQQREHIRETILSGLPDVKARVYAGAREVRKLVTKKRCREENE
jgi:colanic acid/amylovoran biosynthesis protein